MRNRYPIIAILLVVILLCASVSHADADSDTSGVFPGAPRGRSAIDYVLAVPSFLLKAPFRILSYGASKPVTLVESQSLAPQLQRWLSFAEIDGVYPIMSWGARSGPTGGVGWAKPHIIRPGIGLAVEGSYSLNVYRHALVQVGGKRWGDSPYGVVAEGGWRARTRERLFGVGPASVRTEESNYELRGGYAKLDGFRDLGPGRTARVYVGYRRSEPGDGRRTDVTYIRDSIAAQFGRENLYGLFSTVDLYEAGGEVVLDWRDRPGSPLRGGTERLRISYVTGGDTEGTDVGFWKIQGEATQYLNIYRGRVIGVRVLAEVTEPDAGTRVPFYELARLGGSRNLRGYNTRRFIGRDMVMFTVEYRWPIWRQIDAVLFTDHGRVFQNLEDDFEFSNFRSDYGGAFRVWSAKGYGEISIARSNESTKFRLSLGGAL